jgi:16S rRNA processing protein RimM
MERPEGLLEIGRIGRPHGVRGDVFVHLTTTREERVVVGTELWGRDRWMTITTSNRSNDRWRVHFEGCDDRNAAEALTGTTLFAEPIDDPDEVWIHDLIGASVVEADGTDRGTCVAVIDNPASDLLELESGALVPATFIVSIRAGDAAPVVTIEPPHGLFELYDES